MVRTSRIVISFFLGSGLDDSKPSKYSIIFTSKPFIVPFLIAIPIAAAVTLLLTDCIVCNSVFL